MLIAYLESKSDKGVSSIHMIEEGRGVGLQALPRVGKAVDAGCDTWKGRLCQGVRPRRENGGELCL